MVSGGRWDLLRSVTVQVLSLGVAAILARIVEPAEFGLVAATTVVMSGFELVGDVGLGSSLVVQGEESERRLSSVFWFSVAMGLVMLAVGFAASPWAARVFGLDGLALLIAAGVAAVSLRVVSAVPHALLRRRLAFGRLAGVSVGGFLTYGSVAVSLAWLGTPGAWAIMIGRVLQAAVLLVLKLLTAGWLPTFVFDRGLVTAELSLGARLSADKVAGYLRKNLDYWLVSRWFGAGPLGFYYIAYVVPDLARQRFTLTAATVLFPVLARFRDDRERVGRAFLSALRVLAFLTLPALATVAVLAQELVLVVFGPVWTEAVGPLRWLAVAAAAGALTNPPAVMLNASGRPERNIVATGSAILALLLGCLTFGLEHGLVGVGAAVLLASIVQLVVSLTMAMGHLRLRLEEILGALIPAAAPLLALVPAAYWARAALQSELPVVRLAAGGAAGGACYVAVALLFFREPALEMWHLAWEMLGRPSRRR